MMNILFKYFLFLGLVGTLASCGPSGNIKPNTQVSLEDKQAIIILATRGAPGKYSVEPQLMFLPYNLEKGELLGRKSPQKPFRVGRKHVLIGPSHHDVWAYHAVTVEPGSYVLFNTRNRTTNETTTYTLGSLAFSIAPGETKYIGEYQYGLPNRKDMTLGELGKNALKAFFTLGLAGMPDPQIISIDASQSEKHMQAAMKTYQNIKTNVSMAELKSDIKFATNGVNLIYKVNIVDEAYSEE